ncbi:hypothetical protein QTN25_009556 [Entamoeba marina]
MSTYNVIQPTSLSEYLDDETFFKLPISKRKYKNIKYIDYKFNNKNILFIRNNNIKNEVSLDENHVKFLINFNHYDEIIFPDYISYIYMTSLDVDNIYVSANTFISDYAFNKYQKIIYY